MKNILIISFFHSSHNQVGSIRTQRFAQYLPHFAWKPYVLTKKSPVNNRTNMPNENYTTFYTPTFPLNKPFHLESLIWIPLMMKKAIEIMREIPIEVILISCPPFHQAMAGILLKKLFGVKLVIDYRDAWGLSPYHNGQDWLHRFIHHLDELMESYLLRKLDLLIVSHQSMKDKYLKRFTWLQNQIDVVYNGFDPEYIESDSRDLFPKFTILHLGNFYAQHNTRDPSLFLSALHEVIIENRIPSDKLQVLFIGEKYREIEKLITNKGLSSYVRYMTRVPHNVAMEYLNKSHVLLLIETMDVITTKVYEYLATGKPMLCLIRKGSELEALILKFSSNAHILPNNLEQVKTAIGHCFEAYEKNKYRINNGNKEFRIYFSRVEQARHLAELLDSCHTKRS